MEQIYAYKDIDYKTIIKGDGLYLSIAAASVLARHSAMSSWKKFIMNS